MQDTLSTNGQKTPTRTTSVGDGIAATTSAVFVTKTTTRAGEARVAATSVGDSIVDQEPLIRNQGLDPQIYANPLGSQLSTLEIDLHPSVVRLEHDLPFPHLEKTQVHSFKV